MVNGREPTLHLRNNTADSMKQHQRMAVEGGRETDNDQFDESGRFQFPDAIFISCSTYAIKSS
ncbi:hypothetical protein MtrunA17_Chr1g0159671 [Medicago truncatula]|uniref:Uncharacterized protein n=1 Tax=Medicago truncatula TaxID=3880 RepID=A0A396JTB5_MEDTR|nr:hypothetical protein MtrunA17_Chr1g0159671 [Medicago truncatula]